MIQSPPNFYWHTRIFRPSDGPVKWIHYLISDTFWMFATFFIEKLRSLLLFKYLGKSTFVTTLQKVSQTILLTLWSKLWIIYNFPRTCSFSLKGTKIECRNRSELFENFRKISNFFSKRSKNMQSLKKMCVLRHFLSNRSFFYQGSWQFPFVKILSNW